MLDIIILSKGRHKTITTANLITSAVVLVPESEESYYKAVVKNRVATIPDEIIGLGNIRNWVIDHFENDVIMVDDDITSFYSVLGTKAKKIKNPDIIKDILENVYICAKDLRVTLFSINQTSDPRKYVPCEPFSLTGWVGSVVGVIGKDKRFMTENKLRVDVDFSLKCLMEDRIIFIDKRFAFYSKKNHNAGGNAAARSLKQLETEKKRLKRKWKGHIRFSLGKETDIVKIDVKRKQF